MMPQDQVWLELLGRLKAHEAVLGKLLKHQEDSWIDTIPEVLLLGPPMEAYPALQKGWREAMRDIKGGMRRARP